MRLPLVTDLVSRDGTTTKDAKIKNGYSGGDLVKRPGAIDLGNAGTGVAQMLTCWNGLLSVINGSFSSLDISVSGTVTDTPIGTVTSGVGLDSETASESQSVQQLVIKTSDKAWIYTR
jgi:hypothetical protein